MRECVTSINKTPDVLGFCFPENDLGILIKNRNTYGYQDFYFKPLLAEVMRGQLVNAGAEQPGRCRMGTTFRRDPEARNPPD